MADGGPYLVGLDAGNTVIKAVLFDSAGRQLAMRAIDGRSEIPHPGHVERDLDQLWTDACEAIRGVIADGRIEPVEIAGIGCAGHGNGLYLLDRAGDALLGIQSLDTRAAGLASRMAAEAGPQLHALCLQQPWPAQTPMLLAWLKEHKPELYERAGTAMLCKDMLTFRLTGERVSEISDMSGAGLLRMPDCAYDATLMEAYGLADAMRLLPRLAEPCEVVGSVTAQAAAETGLAAGTPVIAGYFDVVAGALGSGVLRPGEASIIVGTWSINQVFSAAPVADTNVFMVSSFGPARFVNIESSATSAANLEWYVRELVARHGRGDDPFARCDALVGAVAPASDDPFFHPFLYGCGRNPAARAGFYGLAGWHGEKHMLRALFEGVMFEHRRHIDVLCAAGVSFGRAAITGGGSRSAHWPRIFADGLGVPITVAEARETGALGAAIGAGVGTGMFASYEDGVAAMVRPGTTFAPDRAMRGHYEKRYRVYNDLTAALVPFWESLGDA